MTRSLRYFSAASAAMAFAFAAADARAQQTDTNPPLPNVMLLIDNSGSMERMIDGNTPEADGNACNCTDNGPGFAPSCPGWSTNGTPPSPNRWNIVQTSLTGSLQNGFNCVAMPRSGTSIATSTFASEYQIDSKAPYDAGYYLPFHRLVYQDKSGGTPAACVVAPGGLPGANPGQGVGPKGDVLAGGADGYPSGALVARQYGFLPPNAKACSQQSQGAVQGFAQYPDGAITTMRDLMRFGMMTFDTDLDPSIGVNMPADTVAMPNDFTGMWSYFANWDTGGVPTSYGLPPNCTSGATLMAVGARNPGAPPWEGRMVRFPTAYDLASQESTNDEVASVVLASRPYGGTPLAGMFAGAKNYFWTDPKGPQLTDNYVKGMCRNEYIILLTDGAPNLDMEVSYDPSSKTYSPQCSAGGTPNGQCPFPLPQQTAATLYANGNSTPTQASVKTYVIGFAVSSFQDQTTPVQCSDYATNGTLASQCDCTSHTLATSPANLQNSTPSGALGPCCVLQCIARNGGTNSAYFANTQNDLQSALGSILADIAKNATTRTTPAYSPVITNVLASQSNPTTNSSIYLASFNPSPGKPWSGDVQRQRYVCTYSGSGYTVPPPQIQTGLGDDFAANLNTNTPARTFIAFQPAAVNNVVDSSATIRPYAPPAGGDGIGQLKATVYTGAGTTVDTQVTYQALGLTGPCNYTSTVNGSAQTLSAPLCSQMLLDFTFGVQSFSGAPTNFKFVSRWGNAFGDVYHATPAVVGPPGTLLQDPGYVSFASPSPTGWGSRKTVVYVATNDGLLHAFWADETKPENNELWAMLLPGVMPNLNGSYPSSHAFLLDGSPIVKDVVWDRSVANATTGVGTDWHTMLVASYGSQQSGYYAVDVTNPDPSGMPSSVLAPSDPPPVGPVFRWQLTKMPNGNMPLFATHSATPAITTLFVDPGDGGGAREIGVAILPGGIGATPSTPTACQRWTKSTDSAPLTGYKARTSVRCWGTPAAGKTPAYTDPVVGRSVTVVRLDTGEILRVFARQNDMNAYPSDTIAASTRFKDVPLDSPMTGTPLVYPNDVGSDSTKFFIGDADGTLWRFDLSSSDPSNWAGELYLDLYNQDVDTGSTPWNDGQPFDVTPVLSLDPSGNVVINAATGSIQQFDTSGVQYVYSITEKVAGGLTPKLRANVNWWMQPGSITNNPGERVSGPMTVFNGTLYFATFATAPAGTQSCVNGSARLWGRDFVTPDDPACATNPTSCNRSLGGLREMQPPAPAAPTSPPPVYVEPDLTDPTLAGKVIPGVSIKATPACANLGAATGDQYVYGANHAAPQNFVPGGYSLFSQVGAKGTNGQTTRQFETSVPTPVAPTVIDSWAAVLE
jgi:type IV pilus assembly protein PilY1